MVAFTVSLGQVETLACGPDDDWGTSERPIGAHTTSDAAAGDGGALLGAGGGGNTPCRSTNLLSGSGTKG